jgi:CRISPR-associated endonuclease/helicase Cas3
MTAAIPEFADFFASCNDGRSPFPWQRRLAAALVSGTCPSWVTVPTGLGKTAVIDAWVYSLAASLTVDGPRRTVPTRLIYVVNRRGIVDEAHRRANHIADLLLNSDRLGEDGALRWAADALLSSGHEIDAPLQAVRMRGGISWDWRWLRQPDQPAVVSATVDQFGSRLLFRGYGVGPQFKSLDSALVGTDALVVLDEAHIAEPLAETIASVAHVQSQVPSHPLAARPLRLIQMTATPPSKVSEDDIILSVDDDDAQDVVAGQRIRAEKRLHLVEVSSDKKSANQSVSRAAVSCAKSLIERLDGQVSPTVIVILNTVSAARAAFDQLQQDSAIETALVVGACRSFERTRIETLWRERIGVGRARVPGAKPFVLVATQTVEVGADIDADALVTEACSFDALVQRLGRLDRLGALSVERGQADAVMLWNRHRHGDALDDSGSQCRVYQHASTGLYEMLLRSTGSQPYAIVTEPVAFDDAPQLWIGPSEIAEMIDRGVAWNMVMRAPEHAPVLLPTAVRGWVQTAPIPVPDRPVSPYLHGPGRGEPDVDLCWRDLSLLGAVSLLSALPPVSEESVTLRRSEAARFLVDDLVGEGTKDNAKSSSSSADEGSNFGDTSAPTVELSVRRRTSVAAVRFAVQEGGEWTVFAPGEAVSASVFARIQGTVVVDCSAGGHDEWSWSPLSREPVVDIGDLVYRRRPSLVVSTQRFSSMGVSSEELDAAVDLCLSEQSSDTDLASGVLGAVEAHLSARNELTLPQEGLLRTVRSLRERGAGIGFLDDKPADEDGTVEPVDDRAQRALVITSKTSGSWKFIDPAQLAGGEEGDSTSRTSGVAVRLDSHLSDVAARAGAIAVGIGLSERLRELVMMAADFHDLGKADRRFQTLLRNGDWITADLEDGKSDRLAKSAPGPRVSYSTLPPDMRWPKGLRHEAVSVRLLLDSESWRQGLSSDEQDLVLHLAGAHHGYARPLFPAVTDSVPTAVEVVHRQLQFESNGSDTSVDWNHPARFERLNHVYSPWGLALLEAVVRLADIWVSEEGH